MLPLFDDFVVVVVGGGVLEGDVGDEVGTGAVVMHRGGGLGDVRAGQQAVLDLAQFDALSVQFDLGVGAAQIIQVPSRGPSHQITRAVHACPGITVGVGHEPFRGQLRSTHISVRQGGAAQIQLTDHADGGRVEPGIQYQSAHARDRGADTHPLPR